MCLRPVLALAALALLCSTTAALAADPVPGATYEGTTDTGSPFSFKVASDGGSITDITTSAPLTCVGPEGGVEIMAIVSTVPIPVAGGQINGKDEAPTPRLDVVTGTFTSANEVTGKIEAAYSKFKIGDGVTSCRREVAFTARTSAAAPAGGTTAPAAGGAPAGAPGAAAVTFTGAATAKLATALSKGFALKGTISGPANLVATARLAAKDAKRYGAKVFAQARTNARGGAYALKLKPSKATARKLRKARKVKLVVTVVSTTTAGARSTTNRTVTLNR